MFVVVGSISGHLSGAISLYLFDVLAFGIERIFGPRYPPLLTVIWQGGLVSLGTFAGAFYGALSLFLFNHCDFKLKRFGK